MHLTPQLFTRISYLIIDFYGICWTRPYPVKLHDNVQQGEFEHDEELVHSVSLITIKYTLTYKWAESDPVIISYNEL